MLLRIFILIVVCICFESKASGAGQFPQIILSLCFVFGRKLNLSEFKLKSYKKTQIKKNLLMPPFVTTLSQLNLHYRNYRVSVQLILQLVFLLFKLYSISIFELIFRIMCDVSNLVVTLYIFTYLL